MSAKKPKNKKPYEKPTLKKFGSIKDLTQTASNGSPGDTAGHPGNRTMMCISAPAEVEEHRILLNDVRMQQAFERAIVSCVRKGDVVVDVGTGSAIHAMMAARAGARKVYAIESSSIIGVAREVVEANGMNDVIELIHADSRQVQLPEPADVVISNIGFLYSLKCLPDAARRFLKPGGRMIPSGVQMGMMIYEDQSFYQRHIEFWEGKHFGFDFKALKKMASHHPHYLLLNTDGFLSPQTVLPPIEFAKWNGEAVSFEFSTRLQRDGKMHGLAGFYRFVNQGEVMVTTEPPLQFSPELWNNFILPLDQELRLKSGDTMTVRLSVDVNMIPNSSLWSWSIDVNGQTAIQQFTDVMGWSRPLVAQP